jgi:hypothetical protein
VGFFAVAFAREQLANKKAAGHVGLLSFAPRLPGNPDAVEPGDLIAGLKCRKRPPMLGGFFAMGDD